MLRRLSLALVLVALLALSPRSAAADGCFLYCWDFSGWSDYFDDGDFDWESLFENHDWDWENWDWSSWDGQWNWGDFDDWNWDGWQDHDWPQHTPDDRDGHSVTEPGTIFLLSTGLIGLGYVAWQRREDELIAEDEG